MTAEFGDNAGSGFPFILATWKEEGEHVQFKEAKNRFSFEEAAKCCCALANNGGGKLVFGITDKRPRKVIGSSAFEQPERNAVRYQPNQ